MYNIDFSMFFSGLLIGGSVCFIIGSVITANKSIDEICSLKAENEKLKSKK